VADSPYELLVASLWRGEKLEAGDATVRRAFALAQRNQVDGRFARLFPGPLSYELAEVERADRMFRQNLDAACGLLRRRSIDPVLIKAPPPGPYTYGNFDLVVGEDRWHDAVEALRPWARRFSARPLERTKLLVWPESGPAAHLHQSVSWFDVPVINARQLRAHAVRETPAAPLVPTAVDEVRILLAHAVFQNLALDLSELLRLRVLLRDGVSAGDAIDRARSEGWRRGCERAFSFATATIHALNVGHVVRLPAPLPILDAVGAGFEHAMNLVRGGKRAAGVREALLRPALVGAKRRRMLFS
jgi:hypothetical protein